MLPTGTYSQPPPRIEADARPVHAAAGARVEQSVPRRLGGVNSAFVAQLAQQLRGTRPVDPRRHPRDRPRSDAASSSGGGCSGNGCVGQAARRQIVDCRHRALLDREQRRAGVAVEHEDEARLGRLHDGVDRRRRRARRAPAPAAPPGRSPRDRGARSGSARRARRVAARRATTESENRLAPGRSAPSKSGLGVLTGRKTRPRVEVGGDRRPDVGGAGIAPAVVLATCRRRTRPAAGWCGTSSSRRPLRAS